MNVTRLLQGSKHSSRYTGSHASINSQQTILLSRKQTLLSTEKLKYGIFICLLSAFFYAFMGCEAKWATELGYDAMQPMLFRSGIQIILSLFFSSFERDAISKKYRCALDKLWLDFKNMKNYLYLIIVIRSILSASTLICYFIAISYTSLGNVVAIISIYPIFTAFVARFVLNEELNLVHYLSLILALNGTLLISEPSFLFASSKSTRDDYIGYLFAIGGALLVTGSFVFVRMMKKVNKSLIIICQGIFALTEGSIILFVWQTPKTLNKWEDYVCLLSIGIVGYLAQYTITVGAQLLPAGLSSLLRSTEIIWAYIWQQVFFNDTPSTNTIIGAIVVIVSIIMSSHEKLKKSLDKIRATMTM
eukprot:451453_1